jgi:hypothetical protein
MQIALAHRPILAAALSALTLAALVLSGCSTGPSASHRAPMRPSRALYEPAVPIRQCLNDLGSRQAGFTPLPDQYYGGGCSTIHAVRLLSLRSDTTDLDLTNLGPVTCALADRFAGWARFGVDRAARQILGSPLVRIETMGSYSCRNVAGTEHRSAHATGNAVDVSGFVLADGRRITVLADWYAGTPPERNFLRVIQASACKRFGTVLGPDYNPAHHNHLHLEVSNSAFCR